MTARAFYLIGLNLLANSLRDGDLYQKRNVEKPVSGLSEGFIYEA